MTYTEEERTVFGDAAGAHGPRENGRAHFVTSWTPLDLESVVAGVQSGQIVGPMPELMARTDGACLLYPGEVHSLAGEPESCKGWITLAASAPILATDAVLYLDFEDTPASIVARLLALGAEPAAVVERFVYVRPSDPFTPDALRALLNARPYRLGVIDGVSEAYALLGLDPYMNADAAKFLAALPRPIAERGTAVLEVDHVVKSKEARSRYALGAQHKLAGIAAAYSAEVIKAPSRAAAGLVKVKVEKDRHGHVRGHAEGGVIALGHIEPEDDGGRVTVRLEPPEVSTTEAGEFRPTELMRKASQFIESEPGASLNAIRRGVPGRSKYLDLAVRQLVAEGFVERRSEGRGYGHYSVNVFDEAKAEAL
jgi:AAA domain